MADHTIRRRVEAMKRQKLVAQKVVNLEDYRNLTKGVETKSILVVDDDKIILSALKRILEIRGYRVMIASDGVQLSHLLETSRFHMFLLDVNLPWVNGYELCRLIKAHPVYRGLPLILMSALSKKEDVEKGYKSGCDDYITKPFEMDRVIESVDSVFI